MSFSEHAFHHRPVVLMIVAVLMVYGAVSYLKLPAREDPAITIREAVVTTLYPGLSAERVERLITKTLEEAIRRVPEVEAITSTSLAGRSTIHVEIHDVFFDLDQIWDEVREEIATATADLPAGASQPELNDDFGDVAVVTAALTADGFAMRDMADIAQHIRDTLYTVAGTQRVDLLGVQDERIFIEIENARIAELGITPDRLIGDLETQNVIRPGGTIDTGERDFLIEPTGNFESVAELEETLIRVPDSGDLVPLRDLARVSRATIDPPERRAYHNGVPAIIIAVAMRDDVRVLDYAPRVRALLAALEATLPVGYRLEIVTDQSDQVATAVYGVSASVLQTLAIVCAVVVLFLGLRTGLIVGSIVPAVMLVTLAVMGFTEMPLERMSLATLVIALGLLVDNGIVIAEDFKRRLEDGEDRASALGASGRELALPLLSSTLTTILVFLPLMLAEHVAGEYTRAISLVILISLLTSWLVAITVTPTLCHAFIRIKPRSAGARGGPSQRLFDALTTGYTALLRRLLRRRRLFIALVLALLVGGVAGIAHAPKRFFPDSDRTQVLVYIDLPAGVSSRTTDATLRRVFAALDQPGRLAHVTGHAAYIGFGGPRFVLSLTPVDPAPNRAFMVLDVDTLAHMDATIAELRALLREEFPELSARAARMFLGPSDSGVIEVQVRGPDADYIYAMADRVVAALAAVPGTIDLRHDWENRISRLKVEVDQARARRAGVSSRDVATAMAAYLSGRQVTEFREGDDIFPVMVRAVADERGDLERLRSLTVFPAGGGEPVPLMQVAELRLVNDFAAIAREDLVRTVTVEARNTHLTAEDMVPLITPALDALRAELPPGYEIVFDGVVTKSAEGRAALSANLPLCIALMLVLLVAQFNGYARPAIIVATIPPLLIGASLGLTLSGANFGFMPILGIYALAGIVVNNAIVLIDRIDLERALPGADPHEAVIRAAARRLRPILMTTVTTIFGLSPLIIGRDPLFYGMASVIAGGLTVATLITLGLTPALYTLIFGIRPARPAPRLEEPAQHSDGAAFLDPADHFGGMVAGRLGEQPEAVIDRAAFGIVSAEKEPA